MKILPKSGIMLKCSLMLINARWNPPVTIFFNYYYTLYHGGFQAPLVDVPGGCVQLQKQASSLETMSCFDPGSVYRAENGESPSQLRRGRFIIQVFNELFMMVFWRKICKILIMLYTVHHCPPKLLDYISGTCITKFSKLS